MNQAFYTGIVGIQSHQYGIDLVSDNIANINTTGYRASRVEFASLFETALGTTSADAPLDSSVGTGSRVQATSMLESSGAMSDTGVTTNLALEGEGWFGIATAEGKRYTRAGDFGFDASRDLVTPDGSYVLGTVGANISNGMLTQVLDTVPLDGADKQTALNLPDNLLFPVKPTTETALFGNLGVDDVPRRIGAEVIDADGSRNALELRFTQSTPQPESGLLWEVAATVTGSDGTLYDSRNATVTFDEFGALTATTLSGIDNNGTFVAIDLGTGYSGIQATANESAGTFSSVANGAEGGELVGYDINQNADIIATFTNGYQSAVGKVAVYHFQNDQGLERVSGTRFRESANSGSAFFYTDEAGNAIPGATVRSSMLEHSNVRLETSLTELIVLQRAFDANAKSVTTGDELIRKALEMDA
jgi:flagellar hook protein FlgE